MKLRNKKTGDVWEFDMISMDISRTTLEKLGASTFGTGSYYANSIAELTEEWDDYKPTEPLIKDEKIREIIRLWAKVNSVVGLTYNVAENSLTDIFRNEITFNGWLGLKDGKEYTIAELCGEAEE